MDNLYTVYVLYIEHQDKDGGIWGGDVKIGISNNVEQRIIQLQTGNSEKIRWYTDLIVNVPKDIAIQIEKQAHKTFKPLKKSGRVV